MALGLILGFGRLGAVCYGGHKCVELSVILQIEKPLISSKINIALPAAIARLQQRGHDFFCYVNCGVVEFSLMGGSPPRLIDRGELRCHAKKSRAIAFPNLAPGQGRVDRLGQISFSLQRLTVIIIHLAQYVAHQR